ncbi:MAG: hypothetical protein BV456_04850 [Thermoplasmata archaeon M8B2D]|nr:MAG: hypothetical protein BV456_04850 [Thermoplasmata archaeon M8B2D]
MYYIIKTNSGYFRATEKYYSSVTSINKLYKAEYQFKYENSRYFKSLNETLNTIKTNTKYKNYIIIGKVESLENIETNYPELFI